MTEHTVKKRLTYRSSPSNHIHAAYLGRVRIGYVEERTRYPQQGWLWQLSLVHPHGGVYMGKADTRDEAEDMLERSLKHWMTEANVTHKPRGRA